MADAGLLSVKITADDKELVAALARARQAVKSTSANIKEGVVEFTKYGAAIAAAGVAIGGAFVTQTFKAIDAQADLAHQLGASVTGVQSLMRAGDLAGASQESLSAAVGMLNTKLGQAINGAGTAGGALKQLGLSAEALSKMDVDERVAAISDRINALGYGTEQTAAVLRELGIRQGELIDLFRNGGDAIRDARSELVGFGVAVSDIDAERIGAADDALKKIRLTLDGIATQAAIAVAPMLQEIGDRLGGVGEQSNGFRDQVVAAVESIAKGVGFLGDMFQGLHVVIKGGEVIARGVAAAFLTAFEAIAKAGNWMNEQIMGGLNAYIRAVNKISVIKLPEIDTSGVRNFTSDISKLADESRTNLSTARDELAALAMQPMPSGQIDAFFDAVKKRSDEAAEQAVKSRAALGGGEAVDVVNPEAAKKAAEAEEKIAQMRASALDGNARLIAELQGKYRELNAIIAEQPQLQRVAAEAAGALAEQYQATVDQQTAAEQGRHQAFLDQLAGRVEAIKTQNATELELALEKYGADQEALEEALLNRVITEQEYNDISLQQQQAHEKGMTDMKLRTWKDLEQLSKLSWKNQASVVTGSLADMTAALATKSRSMFEINKAASASNAAMRIPDMMSGAYNAMVGIPYVGPALGAAAAIVAGAFGAAQVSAIMATQFGGGGGKGGAANVPSMATSSVGQSGAPAGGPAAPSQTLAVTGLDSGQIFDGKTVRALAEKLVEFQKDGGKVVFEA